jgi:hypothetical protein
MMDFSPYIEGLKRREAERKVWLEKRREKACQLEAFQEFLRQTNSSV